MKLRSGAMTKESDGPPIKRQRTDAPVDTADEPPPAPMPISSFGACLHAALTAADPDMLRYLLQMPNAPKLSVATEHKCYDIVLNPTDEIYTNRRGHLLECLRYVQCDRRFAVISAPAMQTLCSDRRQRTEIMRCLLPRITSYMSYVLASQAIVAGNDRMLEVIVSDALFDGDYQFDGGLLFVAALLHNRRMLRILLTRSNTDPNMLINNSAVDVLTALTIANMVYTASSTTEDKRQNAVGNARTLLKHGRIDVHRMNLQPRLTAPPADNNADINADDESDEEEQ